MAALDLLGRCAGGMASLFRGSDSAIELEDVVLARAFASDTAEIGLIWTSAGDAVSGLTRWRWFNREGKQTSCRYWSA